MIELAFTWMMKRSKTYSDFHPSARENSNKSSCCLAMYLYSLFFSTLLYIHRPHITRENCTYYASGLYNLQL